MIIDRIFNSSLKGTGQWQREELGESDESLQTGISRLSVSYSQRLLGWWLIIAWIMISEVLRTAT